MLNMDFRNVLIFFGIVFFHILIGYILLFLNPLIMLFLPGYLCKNITLFFIAIFGAVSGYLIGYYIKVFSIYISFAAFILIITFMSVPWIFFIIAALVVFKGAFYYIIYPLLMLIFILLGNYWGMRVTRL